MSGPTFPRGNFSGGAKPALSALLDFNWAVMSVGGVLLPGTLMSFEIPGLADLAAGKCRPSPNARKIEPDPFQAASAWAPQPPLDRGPGYYPSDPPPRDQGPGYY